MRTALLLTLLVALSGCGDDGAGGDTMSSGEPSNRDGENQTSSDAGGLSPQLVEATKTDGVDADQNRADLLIEEVCRKGEACDDRSDQVECLAEYRMGWANHEDEGSSADCLDAELDRLACLVLKPCDQAAACGSFAAAITQHCGE